MANYQPETVLWEARPSLWHLFCIFLTQLPVHRADLRGETDP